MRRSPCNAVNPKKREWQRRHADEQRRLMQEISATYAEYVPPQERELKRSTHNTKRVRIFN